MKKETYLGVTRDQGHGNKNGLLIGQIYELHLDKRVLL